MTDQRPPNQAASGWYPDPSGQHRLRYWDGGTWTDHVTDDVNVAPRVAAPARGPGAAHPLGGLATALTVLLVLCALAAGGVAVAFFNRVSLVENLFAHTLQEAEDADNAVVGSAIVYFVLFIATGIVWIVWQWRHAQNSRLLGQRDGLGPGWAIGGWFIPIANLFIPERQLYEAARASDPAAPLRYAVPAVVVVWWVLYALGGIVGLLSRRGFGSDDIENLRDIENFQTRDRIAAVGALIVVAAAVAAVVMVRTLTARQHQALSK